MDVFNEELLKFWSSLQSNEVKYIMVGGFATNFNGYFRTTDDADIWIEDSLENRKRLRRAFAEYGMGDLEPLERVEFIPGWTYFHLNNGLRLDIMVEMKGLEQFSFDECLSTATIADLEGIRVPFLHINQLIANKKAVNRPKDQVDVIYLEKILQLRDQNSPQ